MKIKTRAFDGPRIAPGDSLRVNVQPHPFKFAKDPQDPLNELIVDAINKMGAVGEDAEKLYQDALDRLRPSADRVIDIVRAEYASMPEEQYLDRWSLIQLVTELRPPSSLRLLDDILGSAIPPEQSRNPHSFTTVGEEVMIRTTAVEALTRMAAEGDPQALALLLKYSRHPNFSVKRASVQGYLEHGGSKAQAELSRVLPKDEHFILNIRRTDVHDVHQAQGGLHLVCPDAQDDGPPLLPERTPKPSKKA
jgi:hypothetical protein